MAQEKNNINPDLEQTSVYSWADLGTAAVAPDAAHVDPENFKQTSQKPIVDGSLNWLYSRAAPPPLEGYRQIDLRNSPSPIEQRNHSMQRLLGKILPQVVTVAKRRK